MNVSAPNVWESWIVQILPRLLLFFSFFKMQNSPKNHHALLDLWNSEIPIAWLSGTSLSSTEHGFPRVPMSRYVTATWSHGTCPAVQDLRFTDWLENRNPHYSPSMLVSSQNSDGIAPYTALPQSIISSTISVNLEYIEINWEYTQSSFSNLTF